MPIRLRRRATIAVALAGMLAAPVYAADFKLGGSSAAPKAAEAPAKPGAPVEVDAKTTKLLDFLEKEYGILLTKSKDRVARSLVAICINRLPRNGPTRTLLDLAKKDTDPLIRAVAWECLLSRAPLLGMDQYGQLMDITYSLAQADTLRGKMRLGVLDLLAVSQPTKRNKEILVQIFSKCDSRVPADDEVIDGIGRIVGMWKSPDLVEYFIGRLRNIDEAFRAYRVLYAAGSAISPDMVQLDLGDRKCLAALAEDHAAWWSKEAANWKEIKVSLEDAHWRKLAPHLVPPPIALGSVNADDKSWKKDLELRRPSLKGFDVGFVVDVTGSMDAALAWLRRDVRMMMNGLGVVSLEPRIGLTFYRDHGDDFLTRSVPLTGNATALLGALEKMDCKGGGDVPEAVAEAMAESFKANPWNTSATGRKVIVLVADAPGHDKDQKALLEAMAASTEKGFRTHVVKLTTATSPGDQSGLDAIAAAGKGITMAATSAEITAAQPRATARLGILRGKVSGGSETAFSTVPPERDPSQPFVPAAGPVGRRVLTTILVDAINPQYADRVEPMAAVLWELLQEPSFEKQSPFGPIVKVDTERMRNNTTTMRNDMKQKPKGPQDK